MNFLHLRRPLYRSMAGTTCPCNVQLAGTAADCNRAQAAAQAAHQQSADLQQRLQVAEAEARDAAASCEALKQVRHFSNMPLVLALIRLLQGHSFPVVPLPWTSLSRTQM